MRHELQTFVDALAPADTEADPVIVRLASEAGVHFHEATAGLYIAVPRQQKRVAGILVDDSRLGQHFYRKADRLREIAVHEAAHHLDARPFGLLATQCPADRPPWEPDHGPRFVRACCHLLHRGRQMGHDLDADGTIGHRNLWPGFSDGEQYLDTLRDEAERHRHDRLRDILKTSPPAAFSALWLSDTSKWKPADEHNLSVA